MNYKDLDLTYYAKAFTRTSKNKTYIQYDFTVPKRLLDNNITELLPYYRVGNWKTKEIFKKGKLTYKFITDYRAQYTKGIPIALINKLPLNKHDILRIRLENDIIWIEKIDDIYNYKSIYIARLIRQSDRQTSLIIPTIICNGRTFINLDFLGDTLPDVSISKYTSCICLHNNLIEKNDLTMDTKLLCTIQCNKLTIEKLDI